MKSAASSLPAATPVVVLALITGIALLVFGAFRGLDLTDETFYLIYINDPAAYELRYQPFGHVLSPLFHLVDRSLPVLRIIGVAAAMASGAALGHFAGRHAGVGSMALAGAASSLSLYFSWILTPSYNLLANIGVALIIAGVLARPWQVGAVLLGIGGYFAFFGKPTTAAVAAMLVAALLAIPHFRRDQELLLRGTAAVAIALVLIVATVGFDLVGFARHIMEVQAVLGLSNSLVALPLKTARELYDAPPLLLISTTVLLCVLATPRADAWKLVILPLIAAALLIIVWRILQAIAAGGRPIEFGITLCALCLLCIAMAISRTGLRKSVFAVPIALVLAPHVVAFGTFNNLFEQTTWSLLFPILSLCLVARLAAWPVLEIAAYGLALGCMLIGALRPYGYPESVFAQRHPLETRLFKGPIYVDSMTKDFADDLDRIDLGNPVVDLTGNGPGTLVLMGASPPVLPWIITLTPQWAELVWKRIPNRERAWMLGPVAPALADSGPARHLKKAGYRCSSIGTMEFWNKLQTITLCKPGPRPSPS